MAKVGIISMQRIVNYGSFLQAYGLKSLLEEMGHEVQFVDYHVGNSLVEGGTKHKNGIFSKVYKGLEALRYDASLKQKIQFIIYKKHFSKKYHGILGLTDKPNYNPKLDVLVIGSDEVFNCIQQNPNVGYSLELFGKNNNAKKVITYAASFGNTTVEKLKMYNVDREIGNLLNGIETISVRDQNSAEVVKTISSKEVVYNLDPVLAYDFIKKCKLIPKKEKKEKYLILYAYSGRITSSESKWISTYAKNKGLKIYAIGGVQKCADKFISCSPFEVLSYFKNADEVITDTFHGTIFSIITERPFVTLVRKSVGESYGNEEKLTDLLSRLKLKNNIIYDLEEMNKVKTQEINYKEVEEILYLERNKSIEYLRNI